MSVCKLSSTCRRVAVSAFLAAFAAGCGGSAIDPVASKKLKAIADLYCHYAGTHANSGPGDEQTFRKYAQSVDRRTTLSMGVDVDKLDDLFTSPRDQKPVTVRYGLAVTNLGEKAPLIAHESVGVRGKRLAVYGNGRVEELDEAALK